LIVSYVKLQVAEDQEIFRKELEEEVYYTQQSSLHFINTIYQKER